MAGGRTGEAKRGAEEDTREEETEKRTEEEDERRGKRTEITRDIRGDAVEGGRRVDEGGQESVRLPKVPLSAPSTGAQRAPRPTPRLSGNPSRALARNTNSKTRISIECVRSNSRYWRKRPNNIGGGRRSVELAVSKAKHSSTRTDLWLWSNTSSREHTSKQSLCVSMAVE